MSAALLAKLAHLGISVEREGDRLLLDGPEDALSDALVAEIAAAKPTLLATLGSDDRRPTLCLDRGERDTESVEATAPLACIFHPDRAMADGDRIACGDCRERLDAIDRADATVEAAIASPWRCFACDGGERRRREQWGDWVCAFCRTIVAGPDQTERSWRMLRSCGPFAGSEQPSVVWGRERGYLAVRDPHTGDWHEVPYREAPAVWQAAVRRRKGDGGQKP